jgi:outer membrane protein OmpA-like peptidoglycan-associated protein
MGAPPIVHEVLRSPGQPLDAGVRSFFERADDVADNVMQMAEPAPIGFAPVTIQRKCAACEKDDEEKKRVRVQRPPSADAGAAPDVEGAIRATERGGEPMPQALRDFFEPRFAHDFSRVRVHHDQPALQAARSVDALAYTVGNNIVFGAAQYAPHTDQGRHLLAHELTHVIQQGAASRGGLQRRANGTSAPSGPKVVVQNSGGPLLMRQDAGGGPPPDTSGGGDTPLAAGSEAAADTGTGDSPPPSDCSEHIPDRAQEIRTSRTTPGEYTGVSSPLVLSLHNFAIDEAKPKPEHVQVLRELASLLDTHARAELHMHLVGNTDCTGSVAYNDTLSRHRAEEVRNVLMPLISRRVGITWAGQLHPFVSNATADGRSRNRRVDVRFVVGSAPLTVNPPPTDNPPGDHGRPDFCQIAPLICAGPGLPWLLPLVCLIEPELCVLPIWPPVLPPLPPGGPSGREPPEHPPRNQPPEQQQPSVMFVPDVRAANTPGAMNDRISNASPVTVTAIVSNPPPAGQGILVDVDDVGWQAGTATVNGAPSVSITDTTALTVQGTALTAPGSTAPRLQLGAWYGGTLVGASNQFSVSAIMQDWSTAFNVQREFPIGFDLYVDMLWSSDGTSIRDLSECHYVELVQVESETGGMVGMGTGGVQSPDDVALGNIMPGGDTHGTERRFLSRPGSQRVLQLQQMRDTRSGMIWVPSRSSGFHIVRTYERDPERPRCYQLTVHKYGAAVTIGGMSTGGGGGDAKAVWHNLNCDPPPQPPEPQPPEPQPTGPQPPGPQPPGPQPPGPQPPGAPPTGPQPTTCDRDELERRVDQCIDEAKQGAIACTLAAASEPFNPLAQLGYLGCLNDVRERLMECTRQARQDTHCPR